MYGCICGRRTKIDQCDSLFSSISIRFCLREVRVRQGNTRSCWKITQQQFDFHRIFRFLYRKFKCVYRLLRIVTDSGDLVFFFSTHQFCFWPFGTAAFKLKLNWYLCLCAWHTAAECAQNWTINIHRLFWLGLNCFSGNVVKLRKKCRKLPFFEFNSVDCDFESQVYKNKIPTVNLSGFLFKFKTKKDWLWSIA